MLRGRWRVRGRRSISLQFLPVAVRRAARALVRGSLDRRTRAIWCSAQLACRSPPRLSRWRLVFPGPAGIGAAPHRAAKEASVRIRPGLSPAPASRVAVVDGAAPWWRASSGRRGRSVRAARCRCRRSRRSGSGGGGPGGAALARSPMRGRWVAGAGRVRARASMSSPPLRRAKRVRTASGAVAGRAVICRWATGAGLHRAAALDQEHPDLFAGAGAGLGHGQGVGLGQCSAGGGSGSDRIGLAAAAPGAPGGG